MKASLLHEISKAGVVFSVFAESSFMVTIRKVSNCFAVKLFTIITVCHIHYPLSAYFFVLIGKNCLICSKRIITKMCNLMKFFVLFAKEDSGFSVQKLSPH